MTTPTALPVPSSAAADLLFNAEKIDEAVNTSAPTYTDRFGTPRKTLAGAMATISAITNRGAWTTATAYLARDVVSNSGTWYISLDSHTSGATFAGDLSAHWRVYQGVISAELGDTASALNGSGMVGHGRSSPAYASATVGGALQEVIGTRTFNIYVATTGSDSNDGSVSTPFATLQKAFDTLMAIGSVGGTRIIRIAAGTYSGAAGRARIGPQNESETTDPDTDPYQTNGVHSVNYIIVRGADVGYDPDVDPDPVPTTIFEGGGASAVGISIEGPIKVLIKDIKFQNYDGSTSSCGISGDSAIIRCENVHGDGNYYTISNAKGRLEVKGGILQNAAGAEIRSIFLNKHEIGNQQAGAVGEGPFFLNSVVGLVAQEGSTGHADYCTFTNCVDGIYATANARVNYSGSSFIGCTRGVRVSHGYVFGISATFTSCLENKVSQMYGIDAPRHNYSNGGLASDYITAPVTHTGTTASVAILTKELLQGDYCPNINSIRKPQHIEFVAFGTLSGTAGSKQFKLRLGSTLLASVTNSASDTGSWRAEGTVVFTDSNVQAANIAYKCNLGSNHINSDTGTEDLAAADADLMFEVQMVNAADSIVITHAHFKVWG